MEQEIIYTEHYAVIASKLTSPGKEGQVFLTQENIVHSVVGYNYGDRLVIAHRPLEDAPILEGVPLLPEFSEEEDVAELSLKTYPFANPERNAFITGYNKAKETYKYTEEDLVEAYERGMNNIDSDGCHIDQPSDDFNDLIQSLQTKRPKYFECETTHDCCGRYINCKGCDATADMLNIKMKTTTNSQGQTELVGEYIYG